MVQDSVSPVNFFTSSSDPKAVDSRASGRDNEVLSHDEESFASALNRAARSDRSSSSNGSGAPDAKTTAKTPSRPAYKSEKPKTGSRDPFFPHKAIPTHADDVRSNEAASASQSDQAGVRSVQNVMRAHVMQPPQEDAYSEDTENTLNSDRASDGGPMEIDDRKGVIGESYNGAAVAYPISRIGSQGLDEKTRDFLEKQGLWDLPTMVMAQPTSQVSAMRDFVSAGKSSVPVQKPIAQFMASLENELGVTPDRLVQALQNLPPGQLQLNPEKTMLQVVKQLGLKGSDETRAVELYSRMLAQMQNLGGNEKTPVAASLMAMNPNALKGKVTESGLNQSVQSGSLTSGKGEFAKTVNSHQALDEKAASAAVTGKGADVSQSDLKLATASDVKDTDLKSLSNYQNLKGQGAQSGANQAQNDNQSGGQGGAFGAQNGNQNFAQNFAGQNRAAAYTEQASVKDQLKFDPEKLQLSHDLSAEKTQGLKAPPVDQNPQSVFPQVDQKSAASVAAPVGMGASELKSGESNAKHEAIQSIINNAQLLATKGGGEMHMTLKPDHLGEIQLRVAMEGNHVNVQMVTERGEVKKLIEQSVHELRHGLAQHDLNMQKLDVSVGDKTAGGFKQGMPDFTQARDFANQFHQQNARRGMMDDLASFGGTQRAKAGGLGILESAGRAQNLASGRSSGRLNVVA